MDLEDEALVLLGLGGDLDGLLRQNRLGLVPLHATKSKSKNRKKIQRERGEK